MRRGRLLVGLVLLVNWSRPCFGRTSGSVWRESWGALEPLAFVIDQL